MELPYLKKILATSKSELLQNLYLSLDELNDIHDLIEKSIVEIMKELDEDSDCPHKDLKIDVAWRENENIKAIVECKDCNKKIEKELFKKEDKK